MKPQLLSLTLHHLSCPSKEPSFFPAFFLSGLLTVFLGKAFYFCCVFSHWAYLRCFWSALFFASHWPQLHLVHIYGRQFFIPYHPHLMRQGKKILLLRPLECPASDLPSLWHFVTFSFKCVLKTSVASISQYILCSC